MYCVSETSSVLEGKILDNCSLCLSLDIVSTLHNQSQTKCHAPVAQWAIRLYNFWQALVAFICVVHAKNLFSSTVRNNQQIILSHCYSFEDIWLV